MALIAFLVLVALLFLVPAFVAVLALWLSARRTAVQGGADVAVAARRHETLVSLGAALAGAVVAVVVLVQPLTWTAVDAVPDTPSLLWAVGPFLVCVVFCLVRAAGELTWPRPSGTIRTAALVRRTVADLGGGRLVWFLATAAVGGAAIVTFGLTSGSDGRSVAHPVVRDAAGQVVITGASGPYPGWAYGVPILVVLAGAVLTTLATLRLVARRSPLSGVPALHDDAVRRTSAARVLGGAQLTVGGGISLLTLFAAIALGSAGWPVAAWSAVVVGLALGTASTVGGLIAILPRRPRNAPARPGSLGAVEAGGV